MLQSVKNNNCTLDSRLSPNSNKLFISTQVQQNSSQYGKQTVNDRMKGY